MLVKGEMNKSCKLRAHGVEESIMSLIVSYELK